MCSREVVCLQWATNWLFKYYLERNDRLCGLVVRVPGYISRGPGSIPGATRFSEKQRVVNGVHSASWVQFEELLERKSWGSGLERRQCDCGDPLRWPRDTLYTQKSALTSRTSGGRSVGIARSRIQTTGFSFLSSSLVQLCNHAACPNPIGKSVLFLINRNWTSAASK
jgi:hypothetical protein